MTEAIARAPEVVGVVACHLCGAAQGNTGPDVYWLKGRGYRVECHGDDELHGFCGLRTRFYGSAGAAAAAWNREARPVVGPVSAELDVARPMGPLAELAEAGGYRPLISVDPPRRVGAEAMFRIDGGRPRTLDELLLELAARRSRRRLIRDVREAGNEETAVAMEGVLRMLEQ